jgi:hypothetical protein
LSQEEIIFQAVQALIILPLSALNPLIPVPDAGRADIGL